MYKTKKDFKVTANMFNSVLNSILKNDEQKKYFCLVLEEKRRNANWRNNQGT